MAAAPSRPGTPVKDYRLYFLDAEGHIRSRIELMNLADDDGAIREAEAQRDGRAAKLWERGRIVKRFAANAA